MKKVTTSLLAVVFLTALWADGRTVFNQLPQRPPGNIPDGLYSIVGEASHRCLAVPNSSCRNEIGIQTFECDGSGASNDQKFNILADGSGYYTITAAHSDLCLEVNPEQFAGRNSLQQNECSPGKVNQKWIMSQYGVNLEIRSAVNNQCLDIMGKAKGNFGVINLHDCSNGPNQRWRLTKATFNLKGEICRESPSHPAHECYGTNDKQTQVYLGKTLTKRQCEEACQASKVSSCRWDGPQ
jgi:Ricin-type beta-trefoil lectin domain